MASGDPVVQVTEIMPTGTLSATIDTRASGSTPAGNALVYDFDDTIAEYLDVKCLLLKYAGNGITFYLPFTATSATTGAVVWRVGVRRLQDDTVNYGSAHTFTYTSATVTTSNVSGELKYATISVTHGTNLDNWANSEKAIVRIGRDAPHASDTMTGDAELWGMFGLET